MDTEMLKAAEARRSADDLARLLDTANVPIFGVDVEGRVNEWNQKTAATLGWSKIEAFGRDLVETFIAPDDRRDVKEVLHKALHGDASANFEFTIFTPDGKRREILLNATTRRGADGEVVGVISVGQDITELRAITAEQQNIVDDLGWLVENANAPMFGVNIDGLVTAWNRKAADLSGFTAEEMMYRPLVKEFITEEYKASVQDVLNKACQGVETDNFEFPLVTKDGKYIDILLTATTRTDASGGIIGVVGVGQDITTLRKSMKLMSLIADDLTRLIDTAH
jgi:PAS domain S-box-containing protein